MPLSVRFPSLAATAAVAVVVFFFFFFFLLVKRALPKIASPFVGGAVQTGFVCLHGFPTPRH